MARDFNVPPLPISSLTLSLSHHRDAWWWLGWLYRFPDNFRHSLGGLSGWQAIRVSVVLYLHALPWVFALAIGLRILLLRADIARMEWVDIPANANVFSISLQVGDGLALGMGLGIVIALITCVGGRASTALSLGLMVGVSEGFVFGQFAGLDNRLILFLLGLSSGFICACVGDFSDRQRGGLTIGFAVGILHFLVGLVVFFESEPGWTFIYALSGEFAVWIACFRLYYYPLHAIFWFLRFRPKLFRYHPAAWDWMCVLPFPRLSDILVAVHERNDGMEIDLAIDRIVNKIPGQRMQALRAFTVLRARRAAKIQSLNMLPSALGDLPEGGRGFLTDTRRIRELVEDIARAQLRADETSRLYFREIELRSLITLITNFQSQVLGMHEPVATEFRRAARMWQVIAETQYRAVAQAAKAIPAPQVFRAGDPVRSSGEAFVPRFRVLGELEGQVMLGGGCPGVLLRGPRRMGKSSLLKNLRSFLPAQVGIVYVSLQSAKLFSSMGHFVAGLAKAMDEVFSLGAGFGENFKPVDVPPPVDLPGFAHYLDAAQFSLEDSNRRVLLALDEYEMLDDKLRAGVFSNDMLATIRDAIQSHRNIIWAFSGNADIVDLRGADWTSYLISVRTLEVPVLTQEETQLLLTEPLSHATIQTEQKVRSSLFWKEFWGEKGIERIYQESGGWPYFVQLVAETAVTLVNETNTNRKGLRSALLDRAVEESLIRGTNAFYQLLRSQSTLPGEWEYLAAFAQYATQPTLENEEVRRSLLRRRLLVEEGTGQWRLRVPLMARWLAKEY